VISILLVIHVLLSLAIIALVLLQRGKGAEAGASLGGGSSGSVFGARGAANFLSRSTAILATAFFITSLGLAYLAANQSSSKASNGSVVEQPFEVPAADKTAPVSSQPATEVPPAGDVPASE